MPIGYSAAKPKTAQATIEQASPRIALAAAGVVCGAMDGQRPGTSVRKPGYPLCTQALARRPGMRLEKLKRSTSGEKLDTKNEGVVSSFNYSRRDSSATRHDRRSLRQTPRTARG